MDDLALIDCMERVRGYLAATEPRTEKRCQELRAADYRALTTQQLKEHVVAIAANLDTATPAGMRERDLLLYQFDCAPQVAEAVTALPSAWATPIKQLPPRTVEEIGCSLVALDEVEATEPGFAFQLSRCIGIESAANFVTRTMPVLRGLKAYEFLCRIGYPAAVPSADTMRLLHRLGLLAEVKDDVPGRRSFFDQLQRISSATATPLPEIDFLLGAFARGDTRMGLKGVCVPQPRCSACAISNHCMSFRFRGVPQRPETTPIKNWAHDERPRERLLAGERLSSTELLAIILRTGSGPKSAVDLARELLQKFENLHRLEAASPQEIAGSVKGIGLAKAAEIRAAIELGRRIVQPAADARDGFKAVGSSQDIFDLYRPRYKSATQEEFLLLALNTKNRIQREVSISRGTLNASIVHPRDVFNHALREAAAGVIFVHNHPSGDPAPSPEDHALTRRLVEAGNLLGIKVLDHVIIGAQRYFSFADEGVLG